MTNIGKNLIPICLFFSVLSCVSKGQDSYNSSGKKILFRSSSDVCNSDMMGFELITGNVFSAPGNVLDSIPGTLMLTDCLETCQGNELCQSINYETGLCVLFSATADLLPGKYILMWLLDSIC